MLRPELSSGGVACCTRATMRAACLGVHTLTRAHVSSSDPNCRDDRPETCAEESTWLLQGPGRGALRRALDKFVQAANFVFSLNAIVRSIGTSFTQDRIVPFHMITSKSQLASTSLSARRSSRGGTRRRTTSETWRPRASSLQSTAAAVGLFGDTGPPLRLSVSRLGSLPPCSDAPASAPRSRSVNGQRRPRRRERDY